MRRRRETGEVLVGSCNCRDQPERCPEYLQWESFSLGSRKRELRDAAAMVCVCMQPDAEAPAGVILGNQAQNGRYKDQRSDGSLEELWLTGSCLNRPIPFPSRVTARFCSAVQGYWAVTMAIGQHSVIRARRLGQHLGTVLSSDFPHPLTTCMAAGDSVYIERLLTV